MAYNRPDWHVQFSVLKQHLNAQYVACMDTRTCLSFDLLYSRSRLEAPLPADLVPSSPRKH